MKLFGNKEKRQIKSDSNRLPVDKNDVNTGSYFFYSPFMTMNEMLANTTVNACVSIIADSVASLSCNVYRKSDKGRIREQGTHEELLAKNGLYRKIYDLQTAGIDESEASI